MRRFSFFLFLPLVCLAQDIMDAAMYGICSVRIDESDSPTHGLTTIQCQRTSVDLLDEATCVNLTNNVYQALIATDRNLQMAQTNIDDAISYTYAVRDYLDDALSTIEALEREHAISSSDAYDISFPIQGAKDTLNNGTYDSLYALQNNINSAQSEIRSAKFSLSQVTCMSCSPSGSSGSGECPCSDILNEISDTLNDVFDTCEDSLVQVKLLTGFSSNLVKQVNSMVEISSNILARLNIPDDRLWGDISDMYDNISNLVWRIDTARLNIPALFYDIREQIRGTGGGSGPLHLSTEGIIHLNSLAFQIGDYFMTQKTTKESLFAITNLIVYFFRSFDRSFNGADLKPFLSQTIPLSNIYNAFTNGDQTVFNRYNRLTTQGKVTNWFSRVELYLMGLNGWFDPVPDLGEVAQNQDRVTESSLDNLIKNGVTNDFAAIGVAQTNVVRSFSRFLGGLNFVSDGDSFTPFVPTTVQLLPAINTGFIEWPAVTISFEDHQDLFDFCRRLTTLVWYLLIYGFYAAIVYTVVRVSVLLVLYIIHLSRDL